MLDISWGAHDARIDDRLPDPVPILIDETDNRVGVVALRKDVTGDGLGRRLGADDEEAFDHGW